MTVDEPDSDRVLARCSRVTDLADPGPVDAEIRRCSHCDREIWFDKTLPASIARRFPGKPIVAMCLQCSARLDTAPALTGDEQIQGMLDTGMPPIRVAHTVAVAYAAVGLASLEQADLEIGLFPHGKRAQTYIEGFGLAVEAIKRLKAE